MGYIGGGLLLALNLAFIQKPAWFGLPEAGHFPVRLALFSVAVWWAVFSLPFFLWVRERAVPRPGALREALAAGFRNAVSTLREIRRHREIFKYLIAYLVYNDGIETVIVMASVFGAQALGMGQGELIACFLMVQAVAFAGAMAFGHLADRLGHKISIQITLVIYLVVCVWGAFIQNKTEFWIMGAVIGVILGGSQAASRSLLTLMVPREDSAQFFGFFALTGKLATAVGPLVFGLLTQFYSIRTAVAGLAVFFVVGLVLLAQVREPERASSPA
jgi:UMF1 family MFS transporter